MRKEIIIRMQPGSDKYHKRALKVAAAVSGVVSITVTGRDRDLLLVIGDGVDESHLTKKLKKEVGEAEIVQLRTLPEGTSGYHLPGTSRDVGGRESRSPYHLHPTNTPGGVTYPAYAPSPVANPGAARWSGDHGQAEAGYYPSAPSPSFYYASPVAGHGGYGGSSYASAVARSHPANYSPMIERHRHDAGSWRPHHGGGKPSCCSIQ
ncbi:hypothetical protein D1007_08891 [Hordeum vulgare]|uniref:Uncharacterized protein n=1 Tax=Hordeum vulgare subsp. vulgare TaxID=112509 RepID=A0A8I6X8Y1_HORVV|nr:disease resistance protein RGA5-like isoform X1 [Hordeum vulgare subsp. vulgare]KAE8813969.1 hypothetical protein D1007_08891 [Hordeum vulgare]KAI5014750.1 hypothetical protein ZWY2020_056140 [Hordeum vulgare]